MLLRCFNLKVSIVVDSKRCTWFEAQHECAKQNKTLPTAIPSSQVQGNGNTYWTRYSQRKSKWAQLLGKI